MARTRKASRATGGNHKTRSQKTSSSSKNASRAKPSITEKRQIERLARELEEARQQQAASSRVLHIIGTSPGALTPVFQAIVKSAVEVCQARFGAVFRMEGGLLHLVADYNFGATQRQLLEAEYPVAPSRGRVSGRSILTRSTVQIPDTDADKDYIGGNAKQSGFRSLLAAPLLKGDQAIGSIVIYKAEPGTFPPQQMASLQNFATQAVIAIENTRLFNETREALERQTASAEVLQVISSSPGDLKPVFDQILAKAMRLCEAQCGFIYQMELGAMRAVAEIGVPPAFAEYRRNNLHTGGVATPADVMRATRKPAHVHDARDSEPYRSGNPNAVAGVDLGGARTVLYVPMIRNDDIVGVINLYRQEVRPFTEQQISLLENFASQAVIAIENARLFNETQEALERQTATADVLKVIASSPSDVQPVFEAIVQAGLKLFPGSTVMIVLANEGIVRVAAIAHVEPKLAELLRNAFPSPLTREYMHAVAIMDRRLVDVPDAEKGPAEFASGLSLFLSTDHRAITIMPLLRGAEAIGALSVVRRLAGSLSDRQMELLKTFSDQAVIAIENTRLLSELRHRTNDLSEALERQTATADVLNVIGRSPTDAAPVFDVIGERAEKLCDAEISVVSVLDNDLINLAGIRGISSEGVELFRAQFPLRLDRQTVTSRTINSGKIVHVADVFADPTYDNKTLAAQTGYRSCLGVPMHNKGQVIGAIFVARTQLGPFSDNQIQLLQIFADQAVIAIENVRLFKETQEALERQTATADILKVIASSPDDVQPVFQAIADRSNQLVNALSTTVFRLVDGVMHLQAFTPVNPEADARLRATFPAPLSSFDWGESIRRGEIYRVVDIEQEFESMREIARLRGWRSMLAVPLLRDGKPIGMIGPTRVEPGPFSDHHVQLMQTFADQAVIAISNVGLFQQVQQRTRELSQSLDDLRTAQDRLVQTEKLASLGQLTAGIAHEIKNPLNFVNNFSALSAELTGELNELLRDAALTDKMREEVEELTRLLQDNLEKVVQHGKRADTIVRNMLLHSREGSGERRSAEINRLVEESLNLAYHGARAEKADFNITLKHDLDPEADALDLYPQEITRALLNLISNGFYAATRRKAEAPDGDFEPVLSAATRNLGPTVEIRIRDNGVGIPPEVREKMFNPFFTTKPTGEGTGLGLSMTHDIIVKQHGGRIDVETEPGKFTEFIVTLPRKWAAPS